MKSPPLKWVGSFLFKVFVGALFCSFAFPVFAADWPQWRGPNRDGHVPDGIAVPSTLPADPKIVWHFKIGDGLGSPIVSDGKVFYSDNQDGQETLHTIQAADGKELWRTAVDKVFSDSQSAPGPRCTPLVDDGRIYAQSCRGELKCFKAGDGTLIWGVNYSKDFSATFTGEKGSSVGASRHGNNGSPIIDGSHLIACVGGTNGDSVVCFDKSTGKVIWKSQSDQASYAAPILATIAGVRQLIDFTADGVMGLNPSDGKLLWRTALHTSSARHVTTPVVAGDLVLVASYEIGLVAIKVSQSGGAWEAVQAWKSRDSAINFSSPVLVGDYAYALGPQKNFICVDIKTGKQMWSQTGYIKGADFNAYAAFIVMGKNILSLTDGGRLVLFPADPQAFKEISVAQPCGKNWCSPAYADGRLYLRDAHDLFCVDLLAP